MPCSMQKLLSIKKMLAKKKKKILEYKVKIALMQLHLTMKARQLLIAVTAKVSSYGI